MILNKFRPLPRLLSEDDQDVGVTEAIEEAQEEEIEEPKEEEREASKEEPKEEEKEPESEDDLVVTIGDQAPAEDEDEKGAPQWVKELRKKNRELAKRQRELEEENQRLKGGASVEAELLPKKPKIEDFDYDADLFEAALDKFYVQKAEYDRKQEAKKAAEEAERKEMEERQKAYLAGKAKYNAERMAEAEAEVVDSLPPARQAMILDMADDPALVVYAIGTNREVLSKLKEIKSDARFIKELAKIEMTIKVQPKSKTPPPPERTISGSGRTPGTTSANLEKLHEEAQRTGDYSKYLAEKRRLGK